jgi:hypothetical protein
MKFNLQPIQCWKMIFFFKKFSFKKETKKKYQLKLIFKTCDPDYETVTNLIEGKPIKITKLNSQLIKY